MESLNEDVELKPDPDELTNKDNDIEIETISDIDDANIPVGYLDRFYV